MLRAVTGNDDNVSPAEGFADTTGQVVTSMTASRATNILVRRCYANDSGAGDNGKK